MNKRNSAINILFIIICLTSFCIFSINFSRENEAKNQPKCYNSSITKSDTDPFEGTLFEGKPIEYSSSHCGGSQGNKRHGVSNLKRKSCSQMVFQFFKYPFGGAIF